MNTPFQMPDASSKDVILATDLDGTFLGGSNTERDALYGALKANRDKVMLVFVTGRDIPFIKELCADGWVPFPDFVIGDVGTTIVGGPDLVPVPELEAEIAEIWGDSGDRIRDMLSDVPWLELQPTPFRYRVSYYYNPSKYDPAVVQKVEEAGFDCLTSADTYFDVLPRGVSKGPTLLRVVDHLKIDGGRVLVAGDTMNDLSLFETGLRGVAVANSEPGLLDRVRGLPNTTIARGDGAAGIHEVLSTLTTLREAAA
ncbi:MAG: HAD family hydrolase [Alphaproteobacteria bacterium]|nr:HAD family hydrolase [Alphaproteobacteria bacterium]